jgi:hypothetical protein
LGGPARQPSCPYCGVHLQEPTRDKLPQEATKDHVLPEFLGGRKIAACLFELSVETQNVGDHAVLGWVDPINLCERFETIQPIGLKEPHAGFDLIGTQLDLIGRLYDAAVKRDAISKPSLVMRVRVPSLH